MPDWHQLDLYFGLAVFGFFCSSFAQRNGELARILAIRPLCDQEVICLLPNDSLEEPVSPCLELTIIIILFEAALFPSSLLLLHSVLSSKFSLRTPQAPWPRALFRRV